MKAQAQCPAITNHGWPQNAIVRYTIDNTYNDEQKRQVRAAADEWNRANLINNSKVSFVEDTTGQNFTLQFLIGPLAQGNPAVFNGTFDGTTGTVKTGTITYDPNNTFPGSNTLIADPSQPGYSTIVMKLLLHEMGHLMGLDHPSVPADPCDQPDGATVMNFACGINDNGNNIPTTVSSCDQNTINSETIYPQITLPAPTVQIDKASVANPVSEGAGNIAVTVTRTGDHTQTVIVNFATNDAAGLTNCDVVNGVASPRCDFALTVRQLRFAPGETQQVVFIPLVDDGYVEGNESFTISLSNAVGGSLGSPSTATLTIQDNDTTPTNPIVQTAFFVRQHYIDFLGREPDAAGFAGWQNILNNCPPSGKDANGNYCDRIEVSSGFFRSPEFQDRGYFVYRFYSVAFARPPRYAEFMPDLAKVSGFLSSSQLEENKVAFINEFMSRQEFRNLYDALTNPSDYVNALVNTAGVTLANKQQLIDDLAAGRKTRAEVLRAVAESVEVYNKFYNESFVVMQYFGYLRRDPDSSYTTWIQTMNTNGGDYRAMISGFINSNEYVRRFGP
ncbi:MAG TPA: DUF4214 domain-containing protein [Pyrinomonadaceae bacterium]